MLLEGNLTGVQHLGIFVPDLEAAKTWYVDKLGFRVQSEPSFESDGETYNLAFLERDDMVLELVQPPTAQRPAVAQRSHGVIDHFALDVIDIESALSAALARGARQDSSTPDGPVDFSLWEKGVRYVFLSGPQGEKVELNQRLDLDPSRREENVGGWSHLGIPTHDIDASREFYRRLGFSEVLYQEVPGPDGTTKILMMAIGNFMVELYQLPGFDAEAAAALQDGVIDHIALDVRDAAQAFADLQQAGIQPLEDSPVRLPLWENGVSYFNLRGPNGEKIEFNQVF